MSHTSSERRRAATEDASRLALSEVVVDRLRARVSEVATHTVNAITVEVPAYRNALAGPMGARITSAVELALGGFLRLAGPARQRGQAAGAPMTPALDGAYELGRGEARSGRTMDALLAAYRVGAREAWREFSRVAVEQGLASDDMARFAELVFAYIDELSAASAAGHADELATTGRVRDRYLTRLALSVLRGDPPDRLLDRAQRAGWEPPRSLAAVVLPTEQASRAMTGLDERTLRADEDLPETLDDEQASSVLLVADADGVRRGAAVAALRGLDAYVGPARPWSDARSSYLRALRARRLGLAAEGGGTCDTDDHLAELVVGADQTALADLRAQVLAPLGDLRPASAERLAETLRAWLLHQGRRDDVAAALHVHPQTVRYRMTQLRELYGARLDDPAQVAALVIALGTTPAHGRPGIPDTSR
ncbi:PucR family transcriptional regulator [Nocardioides iriomotensis]|uniref:PucR family transcriptional regulator n=1 Tax=Nocardioides iriomotensis TaxID=715784 RepID=A0A4Q5IXC2_9ACTN|nr:PucR family transcriptional regulator [Nocardioides iriomotensis]RYU09848.1 PucR family transcriptional regulator [Nocardioides iriomotensis]